MLDFFEALTSESKNTKKRPLHKNVQRPLTIQAMLLNNAQEQAITEQPLLPRSA